MPRWVGNAAILGALCCALPGCSQKAVFTPQTKMCGFVAYDLEVPVPTSEGLPQPPAGAPVSSFAGAIEKALSSSDAPAGVPDTDGPPRLLSISGGGEFGAFGAGIFSGWNGDGDMPDFHVVTGISTGSILSTFAFVDRADLAVDGYTIDSEAQLLDVYAKPRNGQPGAANIASLLRKGAFADLAPLRGRLAGYLSEDVMRAVAQRHAQGRRLYVGVTNVDTGQAEAFDMGEMATRHVNNLNGRAAQWKDCYIEAIIASSSAPMAARPVFIDNTMYVDGGVRFGMFAEAVIGAVISRQARVNIDAQSVDAPVVYAIVNGTLTLPERPCPKKDRSLCTEEQPMGPRNAPHRNWNIIELALQSEEMLVDQVYRFSAASVEQEACDEPGCFNFMRITDDVKEFAISLPAPLNAGRTGQLSCPEWAEVDIAVDDPIQFQKRYMRCLIAYGKARVQSEGWGDKI